MKISTKGGPDFLFTLPGEAAPPRQLRHCSDPARNLVTPLSWCWKIHFETKTQSQKWEDWSFVHFSVRWNWIILLSADCCLSL